MKKFARILLLLVAILAILLVGGHIFLTKHLTAIVRNNAQPAVEENLGVSFDLKNAAVNLLTGTLSVSDVQLGNPQGFTEPALARIDTIRLAITLSELLRGGIVDLGEVTVKGAELTIENTPGAGINLQTVLKTLNDRAAETESTPPPPSPDTTPSGDSTPGAYAGPRPAGANLGRVAKSAVG